MGIIAWLIVGAIAGWLAGQIMKGKGFGVFGNIGIGIVGAVIGGWVFSLLEWFPGGLIGSILTATIGAVILLFVVGAINKN